MHLISFTKCILKIYNLLDYYTSSVIFESVDTFFMCDGINAQSTNACWQFQLSFCPCVYTHLHHQIQERHPVIVPLNQSFRTCIQLKIRRRYNTVRIAKCDVAESKQGPRFAATFGDQTFLSQDQDYIARKQTNKIYQFCRLTLLHETSIRSHIHAASIPCRCRRD